MLFDQKWPLFEPKPKNQKCSQELQWSVTTNTLLEKSGYSAWGTFCYCKIDDA